MAAAHTYVQICKASREIFVSRGFQCIQQEKPRQGRQNCTEQHVTRVCRRADCSFAPAGAGVVSCGSVTPDWCLWLPSYVPSGLRNRWADTRHDVTT